MKTGIFGGSFDPVHAGHVAVASTIPGLLDLDRLLVVPAAEHPFKRGSHHAPAANRLEMLRLAMRNIESVSVDDCEIRRGGVSYTADTLREIGERYPGDRLCLVIGADTTHDLPSWREYEVIEQLAEIVVVTRPGEDVGSGEFTVVPVPPSDVSATEIRRRLASGLPANDMVPAPVLDYIVDHRLYGAGV